MKIPLILIALLMGLQLSGQILVPADFQAELQSVIEKYDADNNIQGVTAAIDMKDFGLFRGAAGFSYSDVLMDTSMLVGIASNTKLFTATLCVMMADHGYFSLDDSIGKWVDPINFVDPTITLRQLLQHTSGLNDFIGNQELFPAQIITNPAKVWTPEEILTYIFAPLSAPGGGIFYSNTNYLLAAMAIEAATSLEYVDLVRDSIITPLGLADMYFEGFEEITKEMAHPFLFGTDYSSTPRIALGTATWSAGCLVSKPETLIRWYDHLFNGDFLSEKQLTEITSFIIWPDDPQVEEIGLGVFKLEVNGREYYGHGGRTIGYSSYTLYDVECGHSISVAINEFFADALSLAIQLAEKACQLVNSPSNVEELSRKIRVYPNPASERIYVEGATMISLYNNAGVLLRTAKNNAFLDVSTLANGIYFMDLRVPNGKLTKKILIQH